MELTTELTTNYQSARFASTALVKIRRFPDECCRPRSQSETKKPPPEQGFLSGGGGEI
ncbi:hypothetical protein [Prochlorococcus sp. MIT 1201]|uniref:hypothetical protein n=1 Tax=Prochlorococcus sp. MIT 1201 TaxID=3082535 RepID=UPI0039A5718D